MKYLKVPLDTQLPWYTFRISFSGMKYNVEIQYNQRMDRWIFSLYDASMTPILCGVPLLINRNLGGQYTTLRLPPGIFFCVDDSNTYAQPTLSSFLRDHSFYYADPTQ